MPLLSDDDSARRDREAPHSWVTSDIVRAGGCPCVQLRTIQIFDMCLLEKGSLVDLLAFTPFSNWPTMCRSVSRPAADCTSPKLKDESRPKSIDSLPLSQAAPDRSSPPYLCTYHFVCGVPIFTWPPEKRFPSPNAHS